jgi:hypothetical protein
MKELKVPWLRRNLIWSAVNWAAIVGHLFKNLTLTLGLALLICWGLAADLLGALPARFALVAWVIIGLLGVAAICARTTSKNTFWAVPRGLLFTVFGLPFILISIGLGFVLLLYMMIENPKRLFGSILGKMGQVLGVGFASFVAKAETAPRPSVTRSARIETAARSAVNEAMTPVQKRASNLFAPVILER